MLHEKAHSLVAEQYHVLNEQLIPALRDQSICFLHRHEWMEEQKAWLQDYFRDNLQPVLTPLSLDPSHAFPKVFNKALHFLVMISDRDAFGRASHMAVVCLS
jgi:polyphosphate kinase